MSGLRLTIASPYWPIRAMQDHTDLRELARCQAEHRWAWQTHAPGERLMRLQKDDRQHPRERTGGQSLVEFVLVVPILLFLLFGIIDVGRYVYTTTAYGQAAREGARWGSVEQWAFACPGSVVTPSRKACTEAMTRSMVPAGAPAPAAQPNGVLYTCPNPCLAGEMMSVRVQGTFNFFTPIISGILGTPLVSQTAQVVIQ